MKQVPFMVWALFASTTLSATAFAQAGSNAKSANGTVPPKAVKAAPQPTSKTTRTVAKPGVDVPEKKKDPIERSPIAQGGNGEDADVGVDTPELHALREAERELFSSFGARPLLTWMKEFRPIASWNVEAPQVYASGLPMVSPKRAATFAEGGRDLSWMMRLRLPELPIRWDFHVVRYLEFYKDDPRGRSMMGIWFRRAGRYREIVSRVFRSKGLPEDLFWLAMVESGFEATARSPAGACGLFQFMPETARMYGLERDRWVDERYNVEVAAAAAASYLRDLYRRFGTYDLALAAYNMGHGGLASVLRKYNTNDFWSLSRLEAALPWETTLYVPKILAAAIVARNLDVFGYADIASDSPPLADVVNVSAGTPLSAVAKAAGCSLKEIQAHNPELIALRTPQRPGGATYPVRVPNGKGELATTYLGKRQKVPVAQTLPPKDGVSASLGGELASEEREADEKPVVVIPTDMFVYPDRQRFFYRVTSGDTLKSIARTFDVSIDELRRWNDVDPAAYLQAGMTLQVFARANVDLSRVPSLSEGEVSVLRVGSDDFFDYWEGQKGKKRIFIEAKEGQTLEAIGRRFGVTGGAMERINRRGRAERLHAGTVVTLYVPLQASGP